MPGYRYIPGQNLTGLICPLCNLLLRDTIQTFRGVRVCKGCFEARLVRIPGQFASENEQYFVDRAVRREIAVVLIQCDYCNWTGQVALHEAHHNREHYNNDVFQVSQFYGFQASYGDQHVHTAMGHDDPATRREFEPHEAPNPPYQWAEETQGSTSSASQLQVAVQEQQVNATSELALTTRRYPLQSPNTNSQQLQSAPMHSSALEQIVLQEPPPNKSDQVLDTQEQDHMSTTSASSHRPLHQIQPQNVMHLLQNIQCHERIVYLQQRCKHLEQCLHTANCKLPDHHTHSKVSDNREARVSQLERKLEEMERQRAMMMVRISELELQLQASSASTHNGQPQAFPASTGPPQASPASTHNGQPQDSPANTHNGQPQASPASTHNGSFLWRIPDISRRRRDAIEERVTSIYSPPFYTGRPGYKMRIRAYLNGDGIGYKTHLSIFFVLMKGEYDPLLKWPFESKVSLILVDQNHRKHIVQTFKPTPESSSFQRPRSDMNVASGCPQFAKVTVLDDGNYVKDNTMYIKCTVDT